MSGTDALRVSTGAAVIVAVLVVGARVSVLGVASLPDRLAAYAERFGREFRGVVATERYVQVVKPWDGFTPEEPRVDGRSVTARRELTSDLLLVYDAEGPWHLHRDTRVVDGTPVGDRESRLEALFVAPGLDARERLNRMTRDSARYNLGNVTRTVNIPTFPLIVVHPTHRDRFRLRVRGVRQEGGVAMREVTFEEQRRPTLVRTNEGRSVPLRGRLLVDDTTGEFIHARLEPAPTEVASRIEVWFERVEGLPLRVPTRMWEWYRPEYDRFFDGNDRRVDSLKYIEAVATYTDFRRYGVQVEERLGRPR